MEGGDEDMEVDITMQQDGESIKTESDQFIEEWSELDYEQVPNQKPLIVQETSTPTEQVSNPLSIGVKPI